MKRLILSVLAVFAIAAVVVGCGSNNTPEPTPTPTPTPMPTPTPTPTPSNTELQGTWTITWTTSDTTATSTYTFSGNNWIVTSTPAGIQESGTFTLNSTANPKTIDMYFATSTYPSGTSPNVGKTGLGLYIVSGTNLTLAVGDHPGDARPTSFTEDNTITLVKQ